MAPAGIVLRSDLGDVRNVQSLSVGMVVLQPPHRSACGGVRICLGVCHDHPCPVTHPLPVLHLQSLRPFTPVEELQVHTFLAGGFLRCGSRAHIHSSDV